MNPLNAIRIAQKENRFSAVLAELLANPKVVAAVLAHIEGLPVPIRRQVDWSIEAQTYLEESYADLVLRTSTTIIVIEAKLNAPFGPNQPVGYAKWLLSQVEQSKAEVGLVLLTPRASSSIYLDQARERLKASKLSDVPLYSISWEEVRDLCRTLGQEKAAVPAEYLLNFSDLLSEEFGANVDPLSEAEAIGLVSSTFTNGFIKMWRSIEDILVSLKRSLKSVDIGKEEAASLDNFYAGKYITYKKRLYWFGFWANAWQELRASPLWVQMPDRMPPLSEKQRSQVELYEFRNTWLAPVVMVPRQTVEQQVEYAVAQLRRFLELEDG